MNNKCNKKRPRILIYLTLTRVVFEYASSSFKSFCFCHLTLTRVVFEFACGYTICCLILYLTLTRVVFEFILAVISPSLARSFNFNKSCIWIVAPQLTGTATA